ncbi:MAG TPA: LysM peptidoglycan-binding domain-containing protein [Chitinophagaceae bacterium]|nr:LysM peptidoglycan-binding domain-containing protein [Chitinophagaceae bacterium]
MKKPVAFFILFLSLGLFGHAQTTLMVRNEEKSLYLEHVVAPKEGLYSIGRMYNVNPKHLASYNKIDPNAGLSIDQVVRIPLTDTNFTQKSNKGFPIYYNVNANEGLSRVSSVNRKVALQNLRTWNKLPNDNIPEGRNLIIGFLVSKGMTAASVVEPPLVTKKNVEVENPVVQAKAPELVKTETPKETPRETPKKDAAVVKEDKPAMRESQASTQAVISKSDNSNAGMEGYFKSSFDLQQRSIPAARNSTVTSGIFKTSSGWQDGKYYLLVDGVATGSIVKLINPSNNKVIYAKVLGEMNGIRLNEGLGIRISNAAAAALSVGDEEKFVLKMNY